jgi:poly(A) polymerase
MRKVTKKGRHTGRPLLHELSEILEPGREVYLVGGSVRDLALGRAAGDIDLAVAGDAGGFARMIADRLGGTAFIMDADRGVFRVALKEDPDVQVDVSPLKGSIGDDLAARDFTINSMALPLSHISNADVIDPFGGMSDLRAGIIRAVGSRAFIDDPLRLLRAFRLSSQLGFDIEATTLSYIKEHAPSISEASPERVRDELYSILGSLKSAAAFRRMSEAGLLGEIIKDSGAMTGLPQGEPHVYDLLEHSLRAMEHAEEVMREPGSWFGERTGEVREYLDTPVDGGLRMSGLIKLAAFLHDVGKPTAMRLDRGRIRFIGHDEEGAKICEGIAGRLKLSSRAAGALAGTVRWHMRPMHLSQGPLTTHALYRYVRDMGDDLPASLVVSLADAFATRERPDAWSTDVEGLVLAAASYYYGEYRKAVEEPLITGRDLIGLFGLKPGPVFKTILDEVGEKRAEGALTTRDDALGYVRENLGRFI